jgi:hypothetical protein
MGAASGYPGRRGRKQPPREPTFAHVDHASPLRAQSRDRPRAQHTHACAERLSTDLRRQAQRGLGQEALNIEAGIRHVKSDKVAV